MSRRTRRRLRRLRPVFWAVLVGAAVLLGAGGVLAWQAYQAKGLLTEARASLEDSRTQLAGGDLGAATVSLDRARAEAGAASGELTRWLWSAYGRVPVVGPTFREAQGIVDVTNQVTEEVLTPLVRVAPGHAAWRGRADLAALRRAAGPLTQADRRISSARARLASLPSSRIGVLDRARDDLSRSLSSMASDVREASVAAQVLPSLLGQDRPGRLLVVVQNQAEERATGGLPGAFALLRTDGGAFTTVRSGTDDDLPDAPRPVVDLGPEFQARYGLVEATSTWRSANVSPDMRSTGAILAGLSAKQLGVPVDGVVLVDPVALSDLLGATGPVTVPGLGQLTSQNAVPLLLKDVYARYGTRQQDQRKKALRDALDAVMARLGQPAPGGALVAALSRAAASGHVQVFATDPAVEAELLRSRVSGALPADGPYLSLVTQDVGGSKLDYYLRRSVSYVATPSPVAVDLGMGPETVENAVVTVRLSNDAPRRGLPSYVTSRPDAPQLAGTGQLHSWVSLYLGPRSTYSAATVNGKPVALSSQVERGLTVLSTYVSIDPGQAVTLVLQVQQPAAPGSTLLWRQQPRLQDDTLTVRREGSADVFRDYYADEPR